MNDTRLSSDNSVRSPDLTVTVTPALVPPSWSRLVQRVREAEPAALEELYELFSKGIRFYLWRHLGPQDLDDRVHDAFLVVTQSIQSGELREPERLMGFVHTIVRRQVASQIDDAAHARRSHFSQDALATLHDRHIGPEHCCPRQDGRVARSAENKRLGGTPVGYLVGGLRFEVSSPVQVIPKPRRVARRPGSEVGCPLDCQSTGSIRGR